MRWIPDGSQTADCPVCAEPGAKRALLKVGRETLVVCPRCSLHFFPELDPALYAEWDDERGRRGFELGLGLHGSVECLGRIDTGPVRRFLEVGCGTGITLDFARHAFGWEVLGVDDGAWSRAAGEELGVPVVDALLGATDEVPDGAWDLLFACEVIEHVPDPAPFLAAVRAALAPAGVFLLRTPAAERLDRDCDPSLLNAMLSPGFHTMLHTRQSLERALRAAGFSEVHVVVREATLHAAAASAPIAWDPDGLLPSALIDDYVRRRSQEPAVGSAARCGLLQAAVNRAVLAGDLAAADRALSDLSEVLRARHGVPLDSAAEQFPAGAEELYSFAFASAGDAALTRADQAGAETAYAAAARAGEAALAGLAAPGAVDFALQATARRSALQAAALSGDPERFARLLDANPHHRAELLMGGLTAAVGVARWELADRLAAPVEALLAEGAGGLRDGAAAEARLALGLRLLIHRGDPAAAVPRFAALADEPSVPAPVRWSARFHAGYAALAAGDAVAAAPHLRALIDGEGAGQAPPHLAARARELLAQRTSDQFD